MNDFDRFFQESARAAGERLRAKESGRQLKDPRLKLDMSPWRPCWGGRLSEGRIDLPNDTAAVGWLSADLQRAKITIAAGADVGQADADWTGARPKLEGAGSAADLIQFCTVELYGTLGPPDKITLAITQDCRVIVENRTGEERLIHLLVVRES